MNLELHHFFILVEPGGTVAELLSAIGLREGTRNQHEGQGTSNRRFNFDNATLELLWVHDAAEAQNGPGRDMHLSARATDETASPFGLVFSRKDGEATQMPFEGWTYQPAYFPPPRSFHVGSNSANIVEPLCVYMPFIEPDTPRRPGENEVFRQVTGVTVYTPSMPLSNVIDAVNRVDRLSVNNGDAHLMEIVFNENVTGNIHDFRPHMPVVIRW